MRVYKRKGLHPKWAFAKNRKRALKEAIAVLIFNYSCMPQNVKICKYNRVLKSGIIKKLNLLNYGICQDVLKEQHPRVLLAQN